MLLTDGLKLIEPLVNKRFGELLSEEQMTDIIKNKGKKWTTFRNTFRP